MKSTGGTVTMAGQKDPSLETLRGLAILLVVALHVDVWTPGRPPFLYDRLQYVLGFIRMPLFSVISGYVYALRPVVSGSEAHFLWRKARRLLLPMIAVGSAAFLFKVAPPFVEGPQTYLGAWRLLFFPFLHFWFIQALFAIFVVLVVLERCRCLENPWRWLAVMAASVLPSLLARPGAFDEIDLPFSLDGAAFLFPYFLFGLGLHRFGLVGTQRRAGRVAVVLVTMAAAGLTLQHVVLRGPLRLADHKGSLLYLCLGGSLIFLLFALRWKNRMLARLGCFSYSIFLFHIYVGMAVKAALAASGLGFPPAARYGIIFLCAILIPVSAHHLFMRFALTRTVFLGLR